MSRQPMPSRPDGQPDVPDKFSMLLVRGTAGQLHPHLQVNAIPIRVGVGRLEGERRGEKRRQPGIRHSEDLISVHSHPEKSNT